MRKYKKSYKKSYKKNNIRRKGKVTKKIKEENMADCLKEEEVHVSMKIQILIGNKIRIGQKILVVVIPKPQ